MTLLIIKQYCLQQYILQPFILTYNLILTLILIISKKFDISDIFTQLLSQFIIRLFDAPKYPNDNLKNIKVLFFRINSNKLTVKFLLLSFCLFI